MCAACLVHLIAIDLPISITFSEKHNQLGSSLLPFLQPPLISSLFCTNVLLSPCSQVPLVYIPPSMSQTSFIPI
jgi:hypothetical protein